MTRWPEGSGAGETYRWSGSQDKIHMLTSKSLFKVSVSNESRFEKRVEGFTVRPQNRGRTRGVCGTIAKLASR